VSPSQSVSCRPRYVYPVLDARRDFGLFRVAGAGIGNSLIAYFHALAHARETGATLIAPAWVSLKLGPLLRGERSKRFYIGLFRPGPGELAGLRKLAALAGSLFGVLGARWRTVPIAAPATARTNGRLTLVACRDYRFGPLKPWRADIRRRLLEIAAAPLPAHGFGDGFGRGVYIAAHVRLGDFATAAPADLRSGTTNNLRIPLDWYEAVLRRLRAEFPELPIHVLSDGTERELAQVLAVPGVRIRREDNDLAELLALAGARVLVGSQSTFSRWAAFLGNMPSIWLETDEAGERFAEDHVPLLRVGADVSAITRAALAPA